MINSHLFGQNSLLHNVGQSGFKIYFGEKSPDVIVNTPSSKDSLELSPEAQAVADGSRKTTNPRDVAELKTDKDSASTYDVTNNKELMQRLQKFAKESSYAFQDEYCPSPFGESAKDSARRAEWEPNPMSRWDYAEGSEDFEDHDIMKSMLDELDFYYDSGSSSTQYKPKIDEYGYSSAPPARIANNSPFKQATYSYDAEFGEIDINTGKPMPGKTTIVKQFVGPAPEQPVPDNQIEVKDWCNLKGLSLEERKEFLDGVQNIINKNNLEMDARTISYSIVGGYASFDTPVEGYFGKVDNIKGGKLSMEMIKDDRLMALLQKSESVKRNHEPNTAKTQEYTIKVTDNDGNRLANDQILITSGDGSGKQIQMSVDQYKDLGREEITALLAS